MYLEEIQKISTKHKKALIKEICLMYKRILKTEKFLDPTKLQLSDSEKIVSPSNASTISMFETILSLLVPEEKEIIEKEFIQNSSPLWYTDYYSKTTYYKIKNQAMNNLLFLFYK